MLSGSRGLFLALSAAGQARPSSVHHGACLGPGRAPWRCSEHPTSLSSLFFSRGCVPPRCSSRAGAWSTRAGCCRVADAEVVTPLCTPLCTPLVASPIAPLITFCGCFPLLSPSHMGVVNGDTNVPGSTRSGYCMRFVNALFLCPMVVLAAFVS